MQPIKIGLTFLLAFASATIAQAGFLGQTVTADWYVPDNVTIVETHNVVVGGGVELPYGSLLNAGNLLQIDVSDTIIEFDLANLAIWSVASVNGWKFTDTNNTVPTIIGVSLGPMSAGILNLDNSDLSFDANSVLGNFQGVTVPAPGGFFTIKVEFATPEPSGFLLASVALAAMAAFVWRRCKITACC